MKTKKKKVNIDEIIKNNPNIDKELFEESRKQLEQLKKMGTKRSQYNLIIPFKRTIRLPD